MLRKIAFYITLVFNSSILQAQDDDLYQFYYSDFEPDELNQPSAERIRLLYDKYKETHKRDVTIDGKQFVYEYNYFLERLNKSGKVFYGDQISIYLNNLKDFIVDDPELEAQLRVYLIDYPYLNAFTNDFGNIYVNIAAVAKLDSEEEMLYLLAHEIAHVMLSHSYRFETFRASLEENDWKTDSDELTFQIHSFSQVNELQADSLAFELLKNKVNANYNVSLLHKLKNTENPILSGSIDPQILIGNDQAMLDNFSPFWNKLLKDSLFTANKVSDSLSTHPSVEKRLLILNQKLVDYKAEKINYQPIKDFTTFKTLATKVMLATYIENAMYVEALDLVLKMRAKNKTNTFLIKSQVRIMALLTQTKYQSDEVFWLLNEEGSNCNDLDFLKFKKALLALSDLDINLVALNTMQSLFRTNPASLSECKRAYEYSYLFLYENNRELFEVDSINHNYNYIKWNDSAQIKLADTTQSDTALFETEKNKETEKNGKNTGVMDIGTPWGDEQRNCNRVEKNIHNIFLETFLRTQKIDSVHNVILKNYHSKQVWEGDHVPASELEIFIHPDRAASEFLRGKFNKSKKFDITSNAILFQSDNLYLTSRNRNDFKIEYEKTLELEAQMAKIHENYNTYYKILSNSTSSQKLTVSDNYLYKIIHIWIEDQLSGDNLCYSRVDEHFRQYVLQQDVNYLVYNICIVNENSGTGRKFNLNYYEIYFDIRNGGVAYISKIGSKHGPDKFQLEQLVYLSNQHKIK